MREPLWLLRRAVAKPVRRIVTVLDQALQEAASQRAWLSSYYYAFSSKKFRREQSGVLSGIRQYKGELTGDRGNIALLRRNIHRLEKGLLMRPRRDLFGLTYIVETVEAYGKRVVDPAADRSDPGLVWAHDVLSSYFEIAPSNVAIDPLREQFHKLPPLNGSSDRRLIPFRRNTQQTLQVSYESLLRLAEQRCSVRWFLDKKVPRNLIEMALEVAVQAPSACNRQPFEFRIFDDPDLVNRVISVPVGTAGYAENVPAVAVIVGQQRNFPTRTRQAPHLYRRRLGRHEFCSGPGNTRVGELSDQLARH